MSSPSERIGLVTERYPPDIGGLAVSVRRLATGLASRGRRVEVFTVSDRCPPGVVDRSSDEGVTVHCLGRQRRTEDTLADWLALIASEHGRDPLRVLHAYYVTRPAFVAVYAGGALGVPSVVSARGNDLDRTVLDPSKAAHTLHALRTADAVTANSLDLARKAEALAPGRAVTVIPNGVDADRFRPVPPDQVLAARLGADGPVIGFVGEARAKKGLAHLLLSFARVAEEVAAKLILVGGVRKDDRPALDVFRARHPGAAVVDVGHVDPDALPGYYAMIDVVAIPSVRDGLPNALLEAMACGRAIIATGAGGIPDALHHGENGHLVPVGDVDAMAAGLLAMLSDEELRDRYGAAARRTVIERFRPGDEVDRTLALYDEIARDGRVRSSS